MFVLTPETLRDAFQRNLLSVARFSLIVLDECHWATRGHPMAGLCELIAASDVQPRILGLTASPLNSKKGSLESVLGKLLSLTQTELVVPIEHMEDLLSYAAIPDMFVARYKAPAEIWWDKTNSITYIDRTQIKSYPQMLTLTYLRARHAYYIYSFYMLVRTRHLSLKDIPYIDKLNLQEALPLTNGHFLDEIQQFLLQVLRVAEECGVFCAVSALSFYCQAGRQRNGYVEDSSGIYYIPSKTSVNPDRIEGQVLEILDGPFAAEVSALCDFHSVATSSMLTCFALLFLCLPSMIRDRSLKAFAIHPMLVDDHLRQFLSKVMNLDPDAMTPLFTMAIAFIKEIDSEKHGSKHKLQFFEEVKQVIGELCALILESLTSEDVVSSCEEELQLEPWVVDGYDFDLTGSFVFEELLQSKTFLAVTPKLSAVIRFLVERSASMREESEGEEQESWACIMFTQMRLSCISMNHIINIALQSSDTASRRVKADYITGVTQLKKQYQKLVDFKAGKLNFLLASNVAEEGIDVKVS